LGLLAGWDARLVPGLAAVVGALQELAEPAAGLRGIETVGIDRGAFEVIDIPTGEVGTIDGPVVALAVGGEDECAFMCSDENPD
jgi:hypothetical protein